MDKVKDRNQSPLEYLDALQIEYFQNYLRNRIYPKINDRNFYKKVMGLKQVKIEDISSRNGLPNIFTDKTIHEEYRLKVMPKSSIPPCINTLKELQLYYHPGSDVKVLVEEGVLLGKIEEFLYRENVVRVDVRGGVGVKNYMKENVTRIF